MREHSTSKILDFFEFGNISYDAYVTSIANLTEIQDLPHVVVHAAAIVRFLLSSLVC
jgi:hypothetical protein